MSENIESKPETPAATHTPESTQPAANSNALDFARLTPQNWSFINAFISSGNVQKAYQLAKYEGRDASAPYQIFKKLKPFIEAIGDLDVTSRARLQADIKSVLDLPLDQNKKSLTLSEWLRVRKFAASMTPEATQQKAQISVLVINRPASKQGDAELSNGHGNGSKGNDSRPFPTTKDVIIDAETIDPK